MERIKIESITGTIEYAEVEYPDDRNKINQIKGFQEIYLAYHAQNNYAIGVLWYPRTLC